MRRGFPPDVTDDTPFADDIDDDDDDSGFSAETS